MQRNNYRRVIKINARPDEWVHVRRRPPHRRPQPVPPPAPAPVSFGGDWVEMVGKLALWAGGIAVGIWAFILVVKVVLTVIGWLFVIFMFLGALKVFGAR